MKNPDRPLAPHVRSAIHGAQAKMSAGPDRPLASHVKAAIQAKPAVPAKPAVQAKPAIPARPAAAAPDRALPPSHPPQRPALPAAQPKAFLPRPPGRMRAIQRAQDPKAPPPNKFWVKDDQGRYEWQEKKMNPNDYYSIGESHRSKLVSYPVYKKVPQDLKDGLGTGIDHTIWDPLAAPLSKKVTKQGARAIVEHLFTQFCGSGGTGYAVMGTSGPQVFDQANDNTNSCIGLASSFQAVLKVHGIKSELAEVRTGKQPPFIVKVTKFIDSRVHGHIYCNGSRVEGFYKFTNHTALWVPELSLYYDPMASTRYAKLDIDAELKQVGEGVFESIKGSGPMEVSKGRAFVLTEVSGKDAEEPGGFRKMTLTCQQ